MQSCDLTGSGPWQMRELLRAVGSQLAYTDTLGLSTERAQKSQKRHVRLPKRIATQPKRRQMMA